MKKQIKKSHCCVPRKENSCCEVKSIVTIDDRGQMVLPKEIRDKAKIRAGDKFAVITWEKEGKICCITLIKIEELTDVVKKRLGPLLKDII
ncbi:AbrB family transcriptional regulator [candidate division WOR-3 bacterium]|nr:AbrB family transcriptional regulator [candidate division WOR-3 bacterium]